ncbi:sodium/proline symporter [Parasphingopyxis sp.]|uniref:sodium/proline symporter n=1 Tax=Parasphingopyxis sp. TaxID=1920299 RepID=UPI002617E13B|nr:sodium/proline symporter [Parasphingopyxis sp.]
MIEGVFLACLALLLVIGLAANRRAKATEKDYLIAGSNQPAWLVAVSALATLNSGYVFTGFVGFVYVVGLQAIWLSIGWIVGDFMASLFIYRQLRGASGRTSGLTFVSVLAGWHNPMFRRWRLIAGLITLVFLTSYAAAQISAGGKALFATLDIPVALGSTLTVALLLAYCFKGGIRASMWTDAAQFAVMFISMSILAWISLDFVGGWANAMDRLNAIPRYMDWFPSDTAVPGGMGAFLFALGWVFAGFSVVGQPHIMVRYMTLEHEDKITEVRIWYYSLYVIFTALNIVAALIARIALPDLLNGDPEVALITLARDLLPGALVGIILAGIFAATLSTAASLTLASASALSNDLLPEKWHSPWVVRGATAAVGLGALGIALQGSQSVFDLVILSWSTLACAFAPLLTIYALGRRISEIGAIVAMITGVSIALIWRWMGLHTDIYEGFPGIVAGLILAYLLSKPGEAVRDRSE